MFSTMKKNVASLVLVTLLFHNVEAFTCDKTATICETKLVISHFVTMHHPTLRAVYPHDGKLYRYDVTNTSAATPINESEVIVADGFEGYKLVTIFNMTMPGPDIIVYEGQRLIITVENQLLSEAVTVHWHGLHQRGSPYMDGVPFVTQCPINPGSSFKYDFKAAPKGTFWYHSHMGGQRSDGAFGALIIRENHDSSIEDHIIQLQEWSHNYGTNLALRHWKGGRIVDRAFVRSPQTLDGSSLNFMHIDSALINGKGRYKSKETNDYNSTPLQVYNVRMGRQYRFRSINAGAGYPFRVSVDNHMLTIVATDGYDVRPMEYESFIIHPGERYDFILNASGPAANYWIRSQSLQVDKELIAWAILHYEGAPDEEPTSNSNRIPCTSSSKCYVLNCPYRYYPADEHTICHDVTRLRSPDAYGGAPAFVQGQSKEHLISIVRYDRRFFALNGRHFVPPVVSAISQPDLITANCDDCGEFCSCTSALTLNHGDTIQLTMFNMPWSPLGDPMHLHGHSFHVVKMGYSIYNETNGRFISASDDFDCVDTDCVRRKWTNTSWQGNDIPGLELDNPPIKDTIFVPRGGYVVIRFKADNPGLWMLHCHMVLHSMDSFALLFNESFNNLPRVPDDFPECNSYPPIKGAQRGSTQPAPSNNGVTTETSASTTSMTMQQNNKDTEDMIEVKTFWIVVALLVAIILVQLLMNFAIHRKMVKSSDRQTPYLTDITAVNGKSNSGYLK